MLHQFTFKNFKSFRQEVTLDLTASSLKELPTDVVTDVLHERVLKLAALYGANASGKSNVIHALSVMTDVVLTSFADEDALKKVTPYWFEDPSVPTEFSVLFSTRTNIYQYGFSATQQAVTEEYLYQRDKSKVGEQYLEIFDRTDAGIVGSLTEQAEVQTLAKLITKKSLLLSALSRLEIPVVREVADWFRALRIVDYGNPQNEVTKTARFRSRQSLSPMIALLTDPQEKQKFEQFVQAVDVGIAQLGVVQDDFADENEARQRVVSYHRNPMTGELLQTPISAESSGTRKMLWLYVDLKQTLDEGGTVVVDELDAKLHPLLLRYILILFHDAQINPRGAQLIFTTQELFTLDKTNFRRDEVWFVDKNPAGMSDLYSLDSVKVNGNQKVRNDASYGKDYILGRYGAVPHLRKAK
ncbi:ATP/GTP-binding protein [Levilactobacillus lanxiensis]|uniref:ATP/GTP-binding protein n=1 Tax=Levilactobacillus lanxiensis TaxID=2799568 RepID=A0ABW4D2Y8_9LACO|nr:ATP-binding protein [Levilactobacillus lanxiensis]